MGGGNSPTGVLPQPIIPTKINYRKVDKNIGPIPPRNVSNLVWWNTVPSGNDEFYEGLFQMMIHNWCSSPCFDAQASGTGQRIRGLADGYLNPKNLKRGIWIRGKLVSNIKGLSIFTHILEIFVKWREPEHKNPIKDWWLEPSKRRQKKEGQRKAKRLTTGRNQDKGRELVGSW